ncbi:MAG: sigma-70 family RNA polymerase sigma factor [Planctomycetes bacterium]|nr:sigma-70 family RNA polymerase sigma factor [Planctomycetota bacterium]
MSNAGSDSIGDGPEGLCDAHALGTAIQAHFDRLIDRFLPRLDRLVKTVDGAEARPPRLLGALVSGFRDGAVNYAIEGGGDLSFIDAACTAMQTEVARSCPPGTAKANETWLEPAAFARSIVYSNDDERAVSKTVEEAQTLANEVVLSCTGLANSLARFFRGSGFERRDLQQEALIGLREAALKYQPSLGVPFAAFARAVVLNRLRSALRRSGGATEYSARQVGEFRDAKIRLAHEQRREPTNEDVLRSLGWDGCKRENFLAVLRILKPKVLPSTDAERSEVVVPSREADPASAAEMRESDAEIRETLLRLRAAMERLPAEDRELLNLRFFQSLSWRAIGERLGLTPNRVGRKLDRVLTLLRREMGGANPATRSAGSA